MVEFVIVLTVIMGALAGPWFIRPYQRVALLCGGCIFSSIVVMFVHKLTRSADCPDPTAPLPPTGDVIYCDVGAVMILALLALIFVGGLSRLIVGGVYLAYCRFRSAATIRENR